MRSAITRRQWLGRATAAAGACAVGRLTILAGEAPSKKLRTAVIGCGGRGRSHVNEAVRERLVALCDVDDKNLAATLKFATDKIQGPQTKGEKAKSVKPPDIKTYTDYRKMFDEVHKDIDAVFIATPNHHHALPAMLAMKLGKGVYLEKPLCHSVYEARLLADTALKCKVPTQMGNQGHCGEGYRRLCEYIWAGAIGTDTEAHCWTDRSNGGFGGRPETKPVPPGLHWDEWIGPAPFRDFHDHLHPHGWHCWWDFGNGSLGNSAPHSMDGPFWALKLKWPTAVEVEQMVGGSDEKFPVTTRIRYEFPARGDLPPFKLFWWDGRKPEADKAVMDRMDVVASKKDAFRPAIVEELEAKYKRDFTGNGTFYIGDKGIMYTGWYGDGVRIIPEEAHKAFPAPPKTLPRVKDSFTDFIEACKSGGPTATPFSYGADLTELILLGCLAIKAGVGKKVEWDGANAKCPNLPELDRIIHRPYRKGWEV